VKTRSIYKAQGKTITKLFDDSWEQTLEEPVTLPGKDKLLTFDIGPWLVLYPYGDDDIPKSIRERIFGKEKRLAAAIHRETGDIGFAAYIIDDDGAHSIMVFRWMPDHMPGQSRYRIPAAYLPRLDELRNKKRPYKTWVSATDLMWFIDRQIGFDHLTSSLMFAFRFDGNTIEVGSEFYREVSDWLNVAPEDYNPLHYCSTTEHCLGGRNDCGDWSRVNCENCLKSRPPPATGTTWAKIAGKGSWWTGGR
jgi:hypothetical protein